jgi:hypothetical protein
MGRTEPGLKALSREYAKLPPSDWVLPDRPCYWQPRCKKSWVLLVHEERLSRKKLSPERRRWQRLPLAIPVFIRCQDENGKDILEFATALNVSAGGMLVAVRRMLPDVEQYSLEVPISPVPEANLPPPSSRILQARPVRVVHDQNCHLIGLKFSRPLSS